MLRPSCQSSVAVPSTPRDTMTVGHERPPYARDTKPDQRIRRTFPTPDRSRSTSFHAAIRAHAQMIAVPTIVFRNRPESKSAIVST
jgi:hypothetical protein